ncbi:MAG TPA: DUF4870 domain-containing protein [Candidatus Xenobia bacterium]|nr:DUF4870 domain-containing protein [Candidatus Xenobia bacterium]
MGQSPQTPASGSSGGMESNVAAALAYLWIVAIIWLVMEPYNKDRFIRFHSFQALILGIALIVIDIILSVIPIIGWILLIFMPLVTLALLIFCAYKAYNKEMFKLPVIGDFAEKQAGA